MSHDSIPNNRIASNPQPVVRLENGTDLFAERRVPEMRRPVAITGGGDRNWAVSLAVFGFAVPLLVGLVVAAGLGAASYWILARAASR